MWLAVSDPALLKAEDSASPDPESASGLPLLDVTILWDRLGHCLTKVLNSSQPLSRRKSRSYEVILDVVNMSFLPKAFRLSCSCGVRACPSSWSPKDVLKRGLAVSLQNKQLDDEDPIIFKLLRQVRHSI
jgi:hypothetical protein